MRKIYDRPVHSFIELDGGNIDDNHSTHVSTQRSVTLHYSHNAHTQRRSITLVNIVCERSSYVCK